MVNYDTPAMRTAAGKLASLRADVQTAAKLVAGGPDPETPFGDIDVGGQVHDAIHTFSGRVQAEFHQADEHLTHATAWLRSVVNGVKSRDAANAHDVLRANGGHHQPASSAPVAHTTAPPSVGNVSLDEVR